MEAEFDAWQLHHQEVIAKFPGFLSSEIMPSGAAGNSEWTIVLNFQTPDQLKIWQRSSERAAIIAESIPFLEGGNLGQIMSEDNVQTRLETNVAEVILSKVKPGMDDQYREWSVRIQHAQSTYPGYRGMYLQPPTSSEGRWTTLVRYDTAEHLEAWMAAPERAELLKESKAFIEHEELTRIATSFPGWVPIDPETGKGPPNWKTSLLVLLGLFPIVMLEMKFLGKIPGWQAMNFSFATFLENAISVFLTSFATMPLFIIWFGWWLFPKEDTAATNLKGCAILAVVFAIEVAALWRLMS